MTSRERRYGFALPEWMIGMPAEKVPQVRALVRAAIQAEREACAALCDEHARRVMEADDTGDNIHTARYLAAAIRART